MSTLLIIAHDVIGRRMAGPGIRMWELARVLAHTLPVTLIAPRPIDLPPTVGVTYGHYRWGEAASLAPYLTTASIALINGFVAAAHPEVLTYGGRLIIDLYDPVAFENLELFRRHPMTERRHIAERDVALLRDLLRRGDHFLCATERQRDLYIGGLLALGRLTPDLIDTDPLLRHLIDVVPFGVSDDPPQASGQPALRGVLDDLGPDHEIILWSSGLWDWLDPQTVVRAMPNVLTVVPDARLVFLAGRHPGLGYEMITPQQTRQLAAELGLLGKGVHFYEEWIPYERRADFLLEATVMVSLHSEHLETRYAAVRSRVLDHLWVGRPSILSAGDAAAALIAEYHAGEVVPVGDSDAVAAALIRLLTDPQRRMVQGANAFALAQRLRWSQVAQPVLRIVQHAIEQVGLQQPAVDGGEPLQKDQQHYGQTMEDNLNRILHERNEFVKALESLWCVNLPSATPTPLAIIRQQIQHRLDGSLEQRIATLVAQQREFNGTVVNALYRFASAFDSYITRANEQYAALVSQQQIHNQNVAAHLASLTQQLLELRPLVQAMQQALQTLRSDVQTLQLNLQILHEDGERLRDTLPPLHQHVIDLEQRMLDLEEMQSQIIEQMSRILDIDRSV